MKAAFLVGALLIATMLVSGCVQEGVPTGDVTGAVVANEPAATITPVKQDTNMGWETVAEFSGTGTYPMTESFAPTKDNWRYTWTCSGEGTMNVFIMSVGSKVPMSFEKGIVCPDSGTNSVQGVAGKEHYLRLHLTETTPGETPWTVKIEQ
jgi:hypothetical protein